MWIVLSEDLILVWWTELAKCDVGWLPVSVVMWSRCRDGWMLIRFSLAGLLLRSCGFGLSSTVSRSNIHSSESINRKRGLRRANRITWRRAILDANSYRYMDVGSWSHGAFCTKSHATVGGTWADTIMAPYSPALLGHEVVPSDGK